MAYIRSIRIFKAGVTMSMKSDETDNRRTKNNFSKVLRMALRFQPMNIQNFNSRFSKVYPTVTDQPYNVLPRLIENVSEIL